MSPLCFKLAIYQRRQNKTLSIIHEYTVSIQEHTFAIYVPGTSKEYFFFKCLKIYCTCTIWNGWWNNVPVPCVLHSCQCHSLYGIDFLPLLGMEHLAKLQDDRLIPLLLWQEKVKRTLLYRKQWQISNMKNKSNSNNKLNF